MNSQSNHSWLYPSSIKDATQAQNEMKKKVILEDQFVSPPLYLAGMDVSHNPFDPSQMIFSSAVILSYSTLSILETSTLSEKQEFPYIPGFLGFREAPIHVHTFNQLVIKPDIILVDGHGVSHPRGLGIASHLGVLLDIPTIGVAKSILIGKPASSLGEEAGHITPLIWKEKEIAMVIRTKKRCNPLIISAGHKISLTSAVNIVLNCLKGYRLPEPTRQAHLAANVCRRNFIST